MRRQNVITLHNLFTQTADLSGKLRQFPDITDLREAVIETLGMVQLICRILLDEEGEL